MGVGGPGQGPNGTDEWLQVGFSGFPSLAGSDLYYELTLPNGRPTYHQLATDLPKGQTHRFAQELNGEIHRRDALALGAGDKKVTKLPSHLQF